MNDLRLQLINDSIVDESLALGYLAVDYSPVLVLIMVLFLVSSNIVEDKTEDVVLDEEGVGRRLQHKVLHEGLRRILISLELTHHVDQDAAVKHWVAVDRGHVVSDFLECEAVDLFHDLSSALHLLTLEAQETLLSIVQLG